MYEQIAAGFIAGIVAGLTAAWGYWKTIPLQKKKAALNSLGEAFKDGKVTATEFIDAVNELL